MRTAPSLCALRGAAIVAALGLAGCAAPSSSDKGDGENDVSEANDTGPLDLTVDVYAPPEGGAQMASPVVEVAPYAEVQLCYYGTYTGPSMGVTYLRAQTSPGITHHTAVMGVYDDDYPDGTLIDCSDQGLDGMPIYSSLFDPIGLETEGGEPFEIDPYNGLDWIDAPPGVAEPIYEGQRWALDLHYINTSDRPALVNTAFQVAGVPPEEVLYWASPVLFDAGPIDLPTGESSITFDCAFPDEQMVLTVFAHMHYFGRAFSVDWVHADGSIDRIYDIPEWGPAFKDYPRIQSYPPGALQVMPGDTLRTTCAWTNNTGEVQPDPAEMCSLNLVSYPLNRPLTCIDGVYID